MGTSDAQEAPRGHTANDSDELIATESNTGQTLAAAAGDRRLSEHCLRINRFVGATRDVSGPIVIGCDTRNRTFASGEMLAASSAFGC